jgi:hypothetical protein
VWLALWLVLVFDNPEDHPWISQQEKDYIVGNRAELQKIRSTSRCPSSILITGPFLQPGVGIDTLKCCGTAFKVLQKN